jgi:hypothetical protein
MSHSPTMRLPESCTGQASYPEQHCQQYCTQSNAHRLKSHEMAGCLWSRCDCKAPISKQRLVSQQARPTSAPTQACTSYGKVHTNSSAVPATEMETATPVSTSISKALVCAAATYYPASPAPHQLHGHVAGWAGHGGRNRLAAVLDALLTPFYDRQTPALCSSHAGGPRCGVGCAGMPQICYTVLRSAASQTSSSSSAQGTVLDVAGVQVALH